MPEQYIQVLCRAETFTPVHLEGTKWWRADEWETFRRAHEGRWPNSPFWSEEEWHELYSEGYRYCSLLVEGRAVAAAGLWPRTDKGWEVIAVATSPRCWTRWGH